MLSHPDRKPRLIVSIHALVRARITNTGCIRSRTRFNPRARASANSPWGNTAYSEQGFNPRARASANKVTAGAPSTYKVFQSTRSCERECVSWRKNNASNAFQSTRSCERECDSRDIESRGKVSIHALVRARMLMRQGKGCDVWSFNPRARASANPRCDEGTAKAKCFNPRARASANL